MMNELVHENPTVWGSYAEEVENVRRFVRDLTTDALVPVLLGADRPLVRERVLHLCQNTDPLHLIIMRRIVRRERHGKRIGPCASDIRVRIVPRESGRQLEI